MTDNAEVHYAEKTATARRRAGGTDYGTGGMCRR